MVLRVWNGLNGNSAVEIVGEAAPGKSSGDAMKIIGELVAQLPAGIGYEWTGALPVPAGRFPSAGALRHFALGGFSVSGRSVRKLVRAVFSHAGRAVGRFRRL